MKNETCHFYMPRKNKQASKVPISKLFVHPQHPLISYMWTNVNLKAVALKKKKVK